MEKRCDNCAYNRQQGMPFNKKADGTWDCKAFCMARVKFMDREDDGSWMLYMPVEIDVPPGQSRLVPVDETGIVRANDGFDRVYKRVPVMLPCDKFVPWTVLITIAKVMANPGFTFPWEKDATIARPVNPGAMAFDFKNQPFLE
jgi:hypothetical protein